MSIKRFKVLISMASIGLLLLFSSMASAQDEPGACVELGGLAYDNWTKEDSGGTGALPEGAADSDYVRCKACHGWDHMATDGGYVRRSRQEGRSNAGAGDGDDTSRNISFAARPDAAATEAGGGAKTEAAPVTTDQIWHAGTGRAYADGIGSWVALDAEHSAANKAAHQNGYTLGNQHPDFSAGGMTEEQAGCLAEFLNFTGADPSAYFAAIDPTQNPALYTIVDTADAAAGETFYGVECAGCHSADPADEGGFDPDGGILAYLAKDGKFSEFSHKARWGIPDTAMTRADMGSPTSADVGNMMLWMQQLGGTGFAITPGQTGTWWGGPDRSGEGLPIQVGFQADGTMILWVTFFTYGPTDGAQMWLTAVGTVDGDTVTVDVFITNGRVWGDDFDPADGATLEWGTGVFSFTSCTAGNMVLTPNADMLAFGFTDLEYALQRFDDFVISGIACPTPG